MLVEAGAAAYLAPVLSAWIDAPPVPDWHIAATPVAAARLTDLPDARLLTRTLERDDDGAPDLNGVRVLIASAGNWPAERAACRAAKAAGVAVLQFVDTWYGYARRLDGLFPDRLAVIDANARAEAEAEGVPETILVETGHPGLARIGRLPPTTSRKTLFLGAPVRRDYGTSLGYTEDDAWALAATVAAERPDLISDLRYAMHPQQTAPAGVPDAALTDYRSERLAEDFGQVIGMFSTPLIDAFLAGRRSISLQPNATETDMFALSRFGSMPRATDKETLIAALDGPLPSGDGLRSALSDSIVKFDRAVRDSIEGQDD